MMRNERRKLLDRSLIALSREMEIDDVVVYLLGHGVFTDAVVDRILVGCFLLASFLRQINHTDK